jgi:hypothetical protein
MFGVTMDLRISPTHPDDAVTRDAMAKFLTTAFHLILYGP